MLTLMLTYNEVMPDILDFLLPFGRREYSQDFFFTSFRAQP